MHPPTTPKGIPLQDVCDRYQVQWQWDGVTQVVLLEYHGNKAKALVGSPVVVVGKERLTLSAALRRDKSVIYVPEDFEQKVLAPFGVLTPSFTKADMATTRIKTVVVDAGHGGKDFGAKGVTGVFEKDVNLDIARRLRDILQGAGIKVIMTRDTDEFITLEGRTEIATKSDADIFISIHADSNPSRQMHGVQVYYVKTNTKKDLDEEQRQTNERDFLRQLNARRNSTLQGIVADMMYNWKVPASVQLAETIVRHTSLEAQAFNRGTKSCRFFVVRNTVIPAVLVESGFLTNRQEEKKLNTPAHRQKLAEGIAHSILDYAHD